MPNDKGGSDSLWSTEGGKNLFPARNNLHCVTLTIQVMKTELEP